MLLHFVVLFAISAYFDIMDSAAFYGGLLSIILQAHSYISSNQSFTFHSRKLELLIQESLEMPVTIYPSDP